MKVKISKETLSKALGVAARGASNRSVLPVLQNVLLKAEQDCLYMASTNLEIGYQVWVQVQVDEEGEITVPGKTFADLVGTYQGELTLETKDDALHVKSKSAKAKLLGIPTSEFPPMPKRVTDGITLDGEILKRMIAKTAFAASDDQGRVNLTGIHMRLGKQLIMEAADGFRASRVTHELPAAVKEQKFLIPAKAMMELSRVVEGPVTMHAEPGKVVFSMANIQITSQLIDGSYPDLDQVIPNSHEVRVTLPVKETIQACKQASVISGDVPILKVDVEQDQVRISSESSLTGNSETTVTAKVNGDPIKFAVRPSYLQKALEAMGASVVMDLKTPTSPIKLIDGDFLHIIMPMMRDE